MTVPLADNDRALLSVGMTTLDSDRFPSLTPDCPQVHLFERELAEQYGVRPEGHPWFKPVRFHASYRPGHDAWDRKPGEQPVIGVTEFFRVEGEEISILFAQCKTAAHEYWLRSFKEHLPVMAWMSYSNVPRRARPKCVYARCVATRPRAVRAMKPSCKR